VSFAAAHAADLAGHWTSEFDSQIGPQKYTYDFKIEGDHVTGTATYDHSMGKGESKLTGIKLNGDNVSFTESLSLDGTDLVITYTGTLGADEMKLTRQVGDFATEHIVVKRAKPADAPAEKSADAT
ncbi:MAG TPA: hypothetical protein VG871_18120, partial [Vicinamibacterales bacterium]|nr:hypothetical protein [Vicinamibacterales bacterium]